MRGRHHRDGSGVRSEPHRGDLNGSSYNVSSEEQAHALLNRIIESGMPLIKYELREPSLNEIFIEKVGNAAKAGESDEK